MRRLSIFLGLAVVMFLRQLSHAGTPPLINFQGVLKDGSGNPVVDASYSVAFTIYDAATGGTNLWTETQSVSTTNGLFAVLLGAVNPIPDTAFNGSDRWLGIAVSPDPEMPRQQLVSVGYAYRVNSVDSALGGHLTGDVTVSGSVGIGTDDPLGLLHLKGGNHKLLLESSGNADVVIGRADATRYGNFIVADGDPSVGANNRWAIGLRNGDSKLHFYDEVNSFNVMVLQPGGNVGIGTSSPGNATQAGRRYLGIEGPTDAGVLEFTSNAADADGATIGSIQWTDKNSTNPERRTGAIVNRLLGTTANNRGSRLEFWTKPDNATFFERMRIDNNGNVGIGINTPTAKLHAGSVGSEGTPAFIAGTQIVAQATNIDNWAHMAIIAGSLGQARLNFGDGANDDQGSVAYNNVTDAMFFRTADTERMRITGTGNVGIGTASPAAQAHIHDASGTINGSRLMLTQTTTGTNIVDGVALICSAPNRAYLWNYENGPSIFGTNNIERMRIDSTGRVGIGTTAPQGALDVNSTTGAFIVPRMTTAQRNALTPVNGMIIYNTDAVAGGRFEFRENGAWVTK